MPHPVVAADRLLLAMEPFARNVIHLVVDLEAPPDRDRLHRALRRLVELDPILGSRLQGGFWGARWVPSGRAAEVTEGADEEAWLGRPWDVTDGPQVGLHLAGSRILLKVTHPAADAAGTQVLGYRLAALYRGQEPRVPGGDRGSLQLSRLLHPRHWGAHLGTAARELAAIAFPPVSAQVLQGLRGDDRFQVRTLHFPAPQVDAFRRFAARHDATLNDFMVAALLRAMARLVGTGRPLRLLDTINLRRYLPDPDGAPTCNLSAFMGMAPKDLGPDLDSAVARTRAWTGALKRGLPGPWYLGLWGPALRLLPFRLGVALFRAYLMANIGGGHTPPIFTNMGAIDPARLDFGGPAVKGAWMVAPLFRPPAFGCGLSGFRGSLTLTQGFSGGAPVAERVDAWHRALLLEVEEVGTPVVPGAAGPAGRSR